MTETKKKKREKPKYNAFQNSFWMMKTAWKYDEKKIILLMFTFPVLNIVAWLCELYCSPLVIGVLERHEPLSVLLTTIGVILGVLLIVRCAYGYLSSISGYPKITIRCAILNMLNMKACRAAYEKFLDTRFLEKLREAYGLCSNNGVAAEAIWSTLQQLIEAVVCMAISLVLITNVDIVMIIIVIVTSLASHFVNLKTNKYNYDHREERDKAHNKMYYAQDRAYDYDSYKDFNIFGIKPWIEEMRKSAEIAVVALNTKSYNVHMWSPICNMVMTFMRNGAAYAYLIAKVVQSGMSASEFTLLFSAVGAFSWRFSSVLSTLSDLHAKNLDLNKLRAVIEDSEPFKFEGGIELVPDASEKYELRLEDVSYKYPNSDKEVLSHINLTLKPNEKLAIVGLNGAGKTTLIRLLCGFIDPTSGKVTLNGRDIREFNRETYYKLFSMVGQSSLTIAGSIAENISAEIGGGDIEKVRKCAAMAGLDEKIESLPDKYDTKLHRWVYPEAIKLSGGEHQKMLLARALYKNAPIIVLDEPTAALDPIAEADMYSKYNSFSAGKSSVYISHRLASTRFCDRIILLDGNVIAETDTHDGLLKKGGKYAELYEIQSRYYRKEFKATPQN